MGSTTRLGSFGASIELYLVENETLETWHQAFHISRAAYLRLLLPELLTEPKVLYLDCDVIVLGDLRELFDIDLKDNPVAAVPAASSGNTQIPLSQSDTYVNSGVMVMDLSSLREDDFFRKCENIHNEYKQKLTYMDQCIINKYAEDRKTIADRSYNIEVDNTKIKDSDFLRLLNDSDSRVIHFIGSTKPWHEWSSEVFRREWMRYAAEAGVDLSIVPAKSVSHLQTKASILKLNGAYEEALTVKDYIIDQLVKKITRNTQNHYN